VASESESSDRQIRRKFSQSVKAARADTRDMAIDAQIQRNVRAEQTNVAAGDGSISTCFSTG